MNIKNLTKKQGVNHPLKRSKTGLEVEMHILNSDGSISNKGFDLVKKVKKRYPKVDVVQECGKNMLELGSYPDIKTYNSASDIIKFLEKVIKVAKENNLKIYPFSTYPGKFTPKFTPQKNGTYKIKEKIFGKEKFQLGTKAVGFHHHYSLPKSVFDENIKELRLLKNSKLQRSLLNSYNFEIAIDPILTLITQSSPFVDGQNLAKDSRMLIYRGGKKLGYPGLYNNYQQFGGLPPYKQTETDLLLSLKKRQKRWANLVKKANPSADINKLYPYKLDISWNPVKINKHGTLEQRGMDMNYLSIILGVSILIKFCLKKIQRDFIEVLPSDMGIEESFHIKNGIMYIPPHTYIRNILQKTSAYEGFKDDELYEYTKRFYRFAKSLIPDKYNPLLDKIGDLIDKRKSVSDNMIEFAKRKNMISKKGTISNKNAKVIALHFSGKFEKDLKDTKKSLKKITSEYKENPFEEEGTD